MGTEPRGDTPKVPGAVAFGWAPDMQAALHTFAGLSADECVRLARVALADNTSELRLELERSRTFAECHTVLFREIDDRGVYVYRVLDEVRR